MRLIWLLLAVSLLPANLLAQKADAHAADRAYIEKAESDWAESVANHDCSIPERVMADDFAGIDVDGSQYTKADSVKMCHKGPSNFLFNHLGKVEVRFFGDIAIAQGDEEWKLKDGKTGKFVWTDTWLRRNGKWQVVAAEDLIPSPSPF